MFVRAVALVGVLVVAGYAGAQSGPQLLTVFPPGAKAGDTVEVTLAGVGFDGEEKLLFSAAGFTAVRVDKAGAAPKAPKSAKGPPAGAVKFKVTAPNHSGTYDVRVVSKSGLSNPRTFVVGQMNEANEKESNDDVPQAQKVELETTVNGVISTPTDVDFVAFKAMRGQNVVVYCLTSSIDSKLQADLMVSGPDGKQLASNRGYRGGDAVLDFKAPADGEYLVRLSQFAYTSGGPDHFYRLTATSGTGWRDAVFPPLAAPGDGWTTFDRGPRSGRHDPIGALMGPDLRGKLRATRAVPPSAAMIDAGELGQYPDAPDANLLLANSGELVLDNEKNGTAADAQEVTPPCDIAGRIAKKSERHWYRFAAKKGEVWTLEVFAERIGSPVDAYFVLTDAKGKVLTEQDDGPDALSPNQFYTKSDDPGRYRFTAPADGVYKVMVSTREASVQFGVRDQYVLRVAKEQPDFRVAVMPLSPHLPDAGTLARGGSTAFAVFVFRFDGFDGAIELSADKLPKGVTCPPQFVGPGQARGVFVLTCDKDAADWDGFVTITATAGGLKHAARPFTVTWPATGVQANQIPNSPMITRMDRGPGLALAVRGDAPFALTPTETKLTAKVGGKLDVTLKVTRAAAFKDAVTVIAATPNFGPKPANNNPFPPVGTAAANSSEVKVSIDVPANLPPGTHTLVLRGQSAAPVPKGKNTPPQPAPTYAAAPITLTVEGAAKKK